ncbi:MAG: hypothetical protein JW939_08330 [Candidatus Thermoplasmatota archaeon]|nr:hypothetical protein [Candidatus Thermoplasmatota archaeon]
MGGLEEIGSRLGLSQKDIGRIMFERRKWALIVSLLGIITAILSFFIGLIIGLSLSSGGQLGDGYPFAISAFSIGSINGRQIRKWQFPVLFLLGFLTGISKPVFGNGVRYGVFKRER